MKLWFSDAQWCSESEYELGNTSVSSGKTSLECLDGRGLLEVLTRIYGIT